ncbi:MAG: thioredoxin family protein [Bernardetiaceae bacterium]
MQTRKFSFVLALFFALGFTAATFAQTGYKVGSNVDNFTLKNVDGQMIDFNAYLKDHKGAIVIFTCNHCPFAKAYESRIIELDKELRPLGYPVIAINPNTKTVDDDSFEAMQKVAEVKGYPFPYLADDDQKVAEAFGAQKTPHVYIVQKSGKGSQVAFIGTLDNSPRDAAKADKHYVKDAVNSLLKGKVVNPKEVPAVGCTIKWAK